MTDPSDGSGSYVMDLKEVPPIRRVKVQESQLVLSTMACHASTPSEGRESSTLVTPSPTQQSPSHRYKLRRRPERASPRKQLFTQVNVGGTHTIKKLRKGAASPDATGGGAKQLFHSDKDNRSSKSGNVPTTNKSQTRQIRFPSEQGVLEGLPTNSAFGSKAPLPFQKRRILSGTNKQKRVTKRSKSWRNPKQHVLAPWDSLASVVSVASVKTSSRKPKGGRKQSKQQGGARLSSKKAPPMDKLKSVETKDENKKAPIPPELVSVLAPLGIPKPPRTKTEVLQDAASWAEGSSELPRRKRIPRNCKNKNRSLNYSEDSDDEDHGIQGVYKSSSSIESDNNLKSDNGVLNEDGRSITYMYAFKKPSRRSQRYLPKSPLCRQSPNTPPHAQPLIARDHIAVVRTANNQPPAAASSPTPATAALAPETRHKKSQTTYCAPPAKKSVFKAKQNPAKRRSKNFREKDCQKASQSKERATKRACNNGAAAAKGKHKPASRTETESSGESSLAPKAISSESFSSTEKAKKNCQANVETGSSEDSHSAPNSNAAGSSSSSGGRVRKGTRAKKRSNKSETTIKSIVKVNNESSSPRRKKSSKNKKNRVRFAPTTTTFSVTIRVKTSGSSPTRSKKKRQTAAPQSLSESAVQSIASSITQACLAQASSAHGLDATGNSNEEGLQIDRDENGSVEEQNSDSENTPSSDGTSSENIASNGGSGNRKRVKDTSMARTKNSYGNNSYSSSARNPNEIDGNDKSKAVRTKTPVVIVQNAEETGSVVSRLSMDSAWRKEDTLRGHSRPHGSKRRTRTDASGQEDSHQNDVSVCEYPDFPVLEAEDEAEFGTPGDEKTESDNAVAFPADTDASVSSGGPRKMKRMICSDSLAGDSFVGSSFRPASGNKKASPPRKRSRRTLICSESLLCGSVISGFSRASVEPIQIVIPKVPKEVSVDKSSSRKNQDPVHRPLKTAKAMKGRAGADEEEGSQNILLDGDETFVTDRSTDSTSPARKKKQALMKNPERCGNCSGCQRSFDCFTCDTCIVRLQEGIRYIGGETDCLNRICKVVRKNVHVESLGMTRPTTRPRVESAASGGDDDWSASRVSTVDGGEDNRSKSAKRLSRAARLWSRTLSSKKRTTTGSGSVSSVTGSLPAKLSVAKKTRGRKGKYKKNPLHDMELPLPTDGSVASWMEERRNLRALMHYDEADQDWV